MIQLYLKLERIKAWSEKFNSCDEFSEFKAKLNIIRQEEPYRSYKDDWYLAKLKEREESSQKLAALDEKVRIAAKEYYFILLQPETASVASPQVLFSDKSRSSVGEVKEVDAPRRSPSPIEK